MQNKNKILNDFSLFSLEISYFKLIYEQKSVTGAARKIGQDAANISRILSRFEKKLGSELFVRHKTGTSPTQAADQLYQAVAQAQKSFQSNIEFSQDVQREIRIGFSPTIAHSHFSGLMISLLIEMQLHPVFTLAPSIELTDQLKKRELDFVIAPQSLRFPGLISKKLSSENLVLCSRQGKEQEICLLNPDLIGLEKFIQSIRYKHRWMIKDYFVMAQVAENHPNVMALLPAGLLQSYTKLKAIETFPIQGNIHALTWPGSIGVELLRRIEKGNREA